MFSSLVQLFLLALVSIVTVNGFRIISSNDASAGQFTYMASIRIKGKHMCGGAIIHSKYILTAGHCVNEARHAQLSDVTVVTGTIFIDDGSGTTSTVSGMCTAQNDGETPATDIGLIRLTRRLSWNSATSYILYTYDPPEVNRYGILVGWGSKNTKVTVPTARLQYQNVYITDNCSPHDTGRTICTNNGPSTGVCYGDSGSPLVYDNKVVGVVSRAVLCGVGLPDVYSSVSENIQFIQGIIMQPQLRLLPNQC